MEVYKAIANITGALAKKGIEKSRKNQQQGFAYRGMQWFADEARKIAGGLLHL